MATTSSNVTRVASAPAAADAPHPGCAAAAEPSGRAARSRARLLAAATELLVESGPRAVTVDAVAERSGVAKSTLYRHWGSRTDLLVDVMRTNVPDLGRPDLTLGFETALRSHVRQVAAALGAPEWLRIMPALVSLQHQVPEMAALMAADHEAKVAEIEPVLRQGASEGRIPAGIDPRLAVQLLVGPLVFAALMGDAATIGPLADHVVDRFLASYDASHRPTGPGSGPTQEGTP
jgi:AcrR family transcriptional regulator